MATEVTSASILRAQVLLVGVANGVFDAEKTISTNREVQKQEAAKEKEFCQNVARARITRNESIVKSDEDRIFGTDSALKRAMAYISNCKKARMLLFSAASVTDRRLLLRRDRATHLRTGGNGAAQGERPSTVAKHDSVQGTLETEQRTLSLARERLMELELLAKAVIQELETVRGDLSYDAAKRRFAVEQDRAYIISLALSKPGDKPVVSPPEIDEDGVVRAREKQEHVSGLEDRVQLVGTLSASEIKRFQAEYKRVHAKLEEDLSLSTYTLGSLGKRLKGQAKEVDTTTRMAERSLGEIKKKNLTKGDDVGASKVATLEILVDDLRLTRQALQVDIRSKSFLLDIDERCRKVTTVGEQLFAGNAERRVQKIRSAPSLRNTGSFAVYK